MNTITYEARVELDRAALNHVITVSALRLVKRLLIASAKMKAVDLIEHTP